VTDTGLAAADHTAVRVALWRALHVRADPPPHVLEDEIGLRPADPDDGWRDRPDMDVDATRRTRASIVARARFVEDLVVEAVGRGVDQYVVLGAGLDTFAQRRPEVAAASGLRVFEVDRAGPQAWKRRRLMDLGFGVPEWLRLVLTSVRADLRVCASHRPAPPAPLPVPLHVFGGVDDPLVPVADLHAWAAHAGAEFGLHLLTGGHFLVTDPAAGLLDAVRSRLADLAHTLELS
jgi:hypothetical protein